MSPDQWTAKRQREIAAQKVRDRVRKVPFPDHPKRGVGWCCWCGEEIIVEEGKKGAGQRSKRASWHPGCVHQYNLHSRLETQFRFVEKRDGLRCSWPGCGASPERWHSDRIDCVDWNSPARPPTPWSPNRKRTGRAYWRAVEEWRRGEGMPLVYWQIERRTALELDHRVPLWSVVDLPDEERRFYFGPGNLWLLCAHHHRAKTRDEAKQRARVKAVQREAPTLPL